MPILPCGCDNPCRPAGQDGSGAFATLTGACKCGSGSLPFQAGEKASVIVILADQRTRLSRLSYLHERWVEREKAGGEPGGDA